MEWPPAAYSPRTHMIYSHARYAPYDIAVTNDAADNALCPLSKCTAQYPTVPGVRHGVYGAVNILAGKVAWTIPLTTTAPNRAWQ
jgi:hypothetical protein